MSDAPLPVSRPSRVRYAVLGVFCSLAFLTYLDRLSMMRVQDDVLDDFGVGTLTAEQDAKLRAEHPDDYDKARRRLLAAERKVPMSWIFNAFIVGYALFEIPGGWLGDRWGPRRVLFRIVLFWSIFMALTGAADLPVRWIVLSPGPWLLVGSMVVVRFLFGAGAAGAYPNISRAISRWFPYKDRGVAQGTIWMASRIGGAFAAIIMGTLMALGGGWRGAFYILGAVGAVWAVAFYWWFRDKPEQMPGVNAAEADLIRSDVRAGSVHEDTHSSVPWRRLVTSGNMWAIYGSHACICLSGYFFFTFVSKFFKERFEIQLGDSEILSGLPLMADGLMCLVGGRLSDWLVRRTGSRRWGRSVVPMVGLALAGFYMALVPMAGTPALAVVLFCLAAGAQGLMVPVLWSLPADIGGRHAGTVGGALNMAGGVGAFASPLIAAYVERALGWNAVFVVFVASYVVAALLWLRINAAEPLENRSV
jgi:ACS family glucarate transporter-like MFS transporter